MSTNRRKLLAGGLTLGALGVLIATTMQQAPPEVAPTSGAASIQAPLSPPVSPPAETTMVSASPPMPSARADPREDVGLRIAEIEALIDEGRVGALPLLESFPLEREPELAPTVIRAVATLSSKGDEAQQREAARTLGSWLAQETRRQDPAARGNTAMLVQTLGKMRAPEAARALDDALERGALPLHLRTLAASGLAKIGAPGTRGGVEKLAAELARMPAATGFELELQKEAKQAVEEALAVLQP